MSELKTIDGGVTAPKGFRASGACAGIKNTNMDIALLASDVPAAVAGTFTKNRIQGSTVRLCKRKLAGGLAQAVVVNSGNANACNGTQGDLDAERMGGMAAAELKVDEQLVFVCSTGTIGVPMPMKKIEAGIRKAAEALSEDGGPQAARAIMTTDTVPKECAVEIKAGGCAVRIGGMAKGAGMIEPNMATMLSFITTDAAVDAASLQECISAAVAESFNRISVDGDQSCNDTVLIMANGASGSEMLDTGHPDWRVFSDAVKEVTLVLAKKIVKDGEGATKFVTVKVTGAVSDEDARTAARRIANSLLVKTSWYGCDPNWGRVIDAVGYSGAEVVEEKVNILYDDLMAVKNGCIAKGTDLKDLEAVLRQDSFCVEVQLNLGKGSDVVYTCDCSEEYVRINSEYTT